MKVWVRQLWCSIRGHAKMRCVMMWYYQCDRCAKIVNLH
jgi:hypothetical protein